MNYLIVPPPAELAPYVKYFGGYKMDHIHQNLQISTLVNDASCFVVQHDNGRSAMMEGGQFIPFSMLYGMSTASKSNVPVSGFSAVAAVFHPHGIYELFGIDASELTDQEIFLDDFAGWNITNHIISTPDLQQQVNILFDFLRARLKHTHGTDLLVKDSVLKIQQSKGILNVRDLVSYYNTSERKLQRRYKQTIGVSPRHFVKITHFREAMSLLKIQILN
ncbi:MAG: AraC family transcriptional regulator [Cyclobacteriaceae bacterium]|nr:AraC family transcriptional regulator [Cyclobacteriaceae bacterium]